MRNDGRIIRGIWAAIPTPFLPDGALDHAGAIRNAEKFEELGLQGVFCNGLMGESWALSKAERMAHLECVIRGSKDMSVGVVVTYGCLTETTDLARHASEVGAHHAVLMRPPGLYSDEDLYRYISVIKEAISIPIIVFDSAGPASGFSPSLIVRLAKQGLISGVKCTRGYEDIQGLKDVCHEVVDVFDPYEEHLLSYLAQPGCRATLYADPEPYLFQTVGSRKLFDYVESMENRDFDRALRLHGELAILRETYRKWILNPLRQGQPMNAALKHWLARLGYAAGPVRSPLTGLSQDQATELDRALDACDTALEPPNSQMDY